jgi:ribosomal 30S subunit maturation factor RimM
VVGRAHGRDGSFYVERPDHDLPEGTRVRLAGEARTVERRAGRPDRPLIRVSGVADPRPLRGEVLLVEAELEEGEWLASDLVGCRVEGLGTVARVVDGPSCGLLELDDGELVPFVSEAIQSVDVESRTIRADTEFLRGRE